MIEDKLEKLRKEYNKIAIPEYLVQNGWSDLAPKLTPQRSILSLVFGRGLVFASIALLFLVGTFATAQAASPGDFLYPVKLLADDVTAKLTGKPETKVEKRAQEIIDLSQKTKDHFDEAAREYQKTLDETKNEAQKSGRGQQLDQTLDEQEQKFQNALKNNPSAQNKLEEVIKQTQKARGENHGHNQDH